MVHGMVEAYPELLYYEVCSKKPLDCAIEMWNYEAVECLIKHTPQSTLLLGDSLAALPLRRLFSIAKMSNTENQKALIATIAKAFPKAFDISCECKEYTEECSCDLVKHPVLEFLRSSATNTNKLPKWRLNIVQCLLRHSTTCKETLFPETNLHRDLEMKLESLKDEKEQIQAETAKVATDLEAARKQIEHYQSLLATQKLDSTKDDDLNTQNQAKNIVSKIDSPLFVKVDDNWSAGDLKIILKGIMQRFDDLKGECAEADSRCSVGWIAASYISKEENPSKDRLLVSIEALNEELADLEDEKSSSSNAYSTTSSISTSTKENHYRSTTKSSPAKRAKVSPRPIGTTFLL